LAGRIIFQMNQTIPAHQIILRHARKRRPHTNLDSRFSLCTLIAIIKKKLVLKASLYTILQILSVTIFDKMSLHQTLTISTYNMKNIDPTNQLNLFE